MENGTGLVLNVRPALKDQLELWKGSRFRHFQWAFYAIGLVYAYLALAEFLNAGAEGINVFTVALYGFVMVFAIFAALFVPRMRARLMFNHCPLAQESKQYFISSAGIRCESKLSTAQYQWGAYVRVVETQKAFCFYQSPIYGVIIPKRCFSASDEMVQLRGIVRAHFGGKLCLLS